MGDPYEVLGVGRDAAKSEVDAAYRAAARRSHPDLGGDAKEFRRVAAAHELLSDPERRARYDETGDGSGAPRAGASRAEQLVASMVASAFMQDGKHPVRWLCDQIDGRRSGAKTTAVRAKNDRERLASRLNKFRDENAGATGSAGYELIEGVLTGGIAECDRAVAEVEDQVKLCDEALVLLNGLNRGRAGSTSDIDKLMRMPFRVASTSTW
jgi:curved DNA-binding protein CbpA